MGLFAPELVVYNAWIQRRKVATTTKFAEEGQRIAKGMGLPQPVKWTKYHSWYMIMGGFYFPTHEPGLPDFIPGSPELIVTPDAMLFLTKTCPPLLPAISAEDIRDHSKADTIAKLLAALQALYQFLSVVGRLAMKLPVSQLEINTFGHILCAFAILLIWFDKPKDVKVRTPISTPWARPLCAYLWMCSDLSSVLENNGREIQHLFPILKDKPDLRSKATAGKEHESEVVNGHEKPGSKEHEHQDSTLVDEDKDSHEGKAQREHQEGSADIDPNDASPSLSIATLCEAPKADVSILKIQLDVEPDVSLNKTNKFSWSSKLLDPMVDIDAFAELLTRDQRTRFYPAKMDYKDTLGPVRAGLALKYFAFWNEHVVTSFVDSPGVPFEATTGAASFERRVSPPFPRDTLISDHLTDWMRRPLARIWYPALIVPVIFIALLTTLYGALHAWAWKSHFATQVSSCCML